MSSDLRRFACSIVASFFTFSVEINDGAPDPHPPRCLPPDPPQQQQLQSRRHHPKKGRANTNDAGGRRFRIKVPFAETFVVR